MTDVCGCGQDDPVDEAGETEKEPERLWEVSELRAAAVAPGGPITVSEGRNAVHFDTEVSRSSRYSIVSFFSRKPSAATGAPIEPAVELPYASVVVVPMVCTVNG